MDVKEALTVLLDEEHIENYIYEVRGKAQEQKPYFEGNSWFHPRVKRFAEALNVLEDYKNGM